MSLASMIAKQVVKATGDMFSDTDVQKAISAQVDDVLTSEALQGKDGQDYLVKMTKAMLNDDPNFKPDVDRDPNLGLYLEVEHKLFSGNPNMREAYYAAKINNAKLPSRNVMPAPQRFFDPEDKAFKPFLGDMGQQPGGRYLEMGAEGPTDITGEFPQRALIGVTPEGKPVMQVSKALLEGETRTDGRKIKTNLFKKKAGWRWTQVPKGFDPEPPSSFPLVSVEDGKQHYYTLQAEFPEGVELTRYEKSKSEPRLRPTKKGNVHLGKKVGEISVRGKKHPVYDKVEIYGLIGASTAGMLADEDFKDLFTESIAPKRTASAEGGAVTRKIKRGDTLSKISKETGVSVSDLVKLNNIENPDFIRAGDTLVLGAEAQRQPDKREVRKPVQREEPKRTGIRAAAARSTKAAPTESRSLMTRSRQRPTRERTEAPASLLTSTPIKTFVTGLFSSPVLKEDFLRVDEHNTLKGLAKGAIDRGRTGLSYKDYNRDAGSKLGYSMETPTDIVTDPFQALKFTLGKAEIVRDGDRVVVADEFDFNSPENISEKSLVDKIKFLADRTGQYFADDISAYGLAHSVGEVFNPPASGPSFRIDLGNAKDLGITREQFDDLPTLAEYSDRYEGRIKQRMAKGGKIDKKKMACNKPKRTPSHPKKSHVVKACKDGKEKIIRFGEQGAKTAGKPKAGESKRMKAKRKSFKARHRKNIKRGNMSAAYWADKVKW